MQMEKLLLFTEPIETQFIRRVYRRSIQIHPTTTVYIYNDGGV